MLLSIFKYLKSFSSNLTTFHTTCLFFSYFNVVIHGDFLINVLLLKKNAREYKIAQTYTKLI